MASIQEIMAFQCGFHMLWSKCFPLLPKSSEAVLYETSYLFCGEEGSPVQSSWYCFTLVFWVAITSASGSWHFCTAMSRNFRQQGDKSETSFSICRTWADPTDSFQPVTANKIYCTAIKVCKAHLHSLNSLQSASPLEHIHVWSFSQCLLSCGLNTILARLHKCLAGSWSSAVR